MARRGKKLSLDGSVPGVEYNRHRGGYNRSAFDGQRQTGPAQPFQAYTPDPGRMDVFDPAYDGYDWQPRPIVTPPLRLEPTEQPQAPHVSPYERDAQSFLVLDKMYQEMSERSVQRFTTDWDMGPEETGQPAGLRSHDDPLDRIAVEMSINRANLGHLAEDPEPQAAEFNPLERIVGDPLDSDPFTEMSAGLEQQMQEMDEQATAMEPPQPSPEEMAQQMFDEQMQQLMNGFGMPGMGLMGPGPMM